MKKLKRILMVITLMFGFSFGLASCISNDPNSNTGQTETGKTEPTVTAPTAKTLVYNGDAQVLINAGTTTGGKMLYKLAGGKYSEELPSVMAAGTYKVYYKVTGDDKYSDVAEKSIEVTIAKATPTVTAPIAKTLTETSEAQVLVNKGTTTGGTLQYKLGDNGIYSTDLPKAKDAGTYTVYYKVVGDDNYNDVAEAFINVTIAAASTPTKTTPTVTAPTAKTNLVYTGSAQELINAGTTTGGTLQYKLDNGTYGTSIPTATNVGTYTVYYKVVGNDEFNDVAEQSITVTISEASTPTPGTKTDPTVIAPTAKTLTYTGSAQALINAGSTTGGTLQYKLDNGNYGTSIPEATNVGTYTVYYKVVGNEEYNDVAEASITVTISEASTPTPGKTTPTVTAPRAITLTYTGAAQALVNAGSTTGGTLQYKLDNGNYGTSVPSATNAGTYTVYYKVVGNDEYNDVAEAQVTVTIAKATPTVTKPTANSIVYDGKAHELVASGDTTGGTLVYKLGNGTYSEDIPEATNTGTYTVYYKVVGDSNYNDVAEATVIVTISQASSSNNLTVNSVTGSNESIIVEFPVATGKTNEDYVVKYSKDNNTYKEIDKELILIDNQVAKAYIVGLEAGDYYVRVEEAETPTNYYLSSVVQVSEQDRSGYAHFGYTNGVGAYNDDGTLKTGAKVIYVSDATKNTVTYGSYVGLGKILANLKNISDPVSIRFLDTVKTAQWNSKTYSSAAKTSALITEIANHLGVTAGADSFTIKAEDISSSVNTYSNDLAAGITVLGNINNSYLSYGSDSKSATGYGFDSCWNDMKIENASNVTIEGVGENAGLFQWGMTFAKCNSIEIKNLKFANYTEDACSFQGGSNTDLNYGNYWIHNCTFDEGVNNWDVSTEKDKNDGDGSTDFKYCHNVTVSYCVYNDTHKTNLIGSDNKALQYNITLHHNYYKDCKARLPLVRQTNIHIYNNYYDGTTSTGISVRAKCYAFIENNYFSGKNPFMLGYKTSSSVNPIGTTIKAIGNEFSSSVTVSALGSDTDQGMGLKENGIYVLTTKDSASNDAYSKNLTATRTTSVGTDSICTPDGTTSYVDFDTNSTLFYYDSTNHKSDVSILNAATDVPTFTVAHAGAGATYYKSLELYKESSVTPTPTPTPTDTKSITMNSTSYDTIAAALAAIPTNSSNTYEIVLGKGTYNENGLSYNGKATVIISGDTTTKYGTDVIIKGHGSDMTQESTRNLITFKGAGNIILENITLESDWSRADHSGDVQAEVLGTSNTGFTAAYNCSFKSHQDTIRTTGKAWFYDCHIEGDVDFIWMEESGVVALYENCEIVSVYDSNATNHSSYVVAPRMSLTDNVGKGVVIFNSTITEENSAQTTYLARTPWNSGYYNQAAFINTTCTGVETAAWSNASISTDYPKTVIGWKMDAATKTSIGYAGTSDVLDSTTVANEFSGRKAILNRIYNTSSSKYLKDSDGYWNIDTFITTMGWNVAQDTSSDLLAGETEPVKYYYDFAGQNTSADHAYAWSTGLSSLGESTTCVLTLSGSYYDNSNSMRMTTGASITFSVAAGTAVTVVSYPNYHGYTINGFSTENDSQTIYFANATTVTITATETYYIKQIVIELDSELTAATVSSISLSGYADELAKDATFTTGDLKVKVNYSDGTYKMLTSSDYTVDSSLVNMSTEGDYTVTVTYTSENKSNNYTVSVVNAISNAFDSNFTITFGNNGNYSGLSKLAISDTTKLRNNGVNDTQITEGNILTFEVNTGASITITGNWSVGYTINGDTVRTSNAGGTDDSGLSHTYVSTSGGTITITSIHNNNYFITIEIAY